MTSEQELHGFLSPLHLYLQEHVAARISRELEVVIAMDQHLDVFCGGDNPKVGASNKGFEKWRKQNTKANLAKIAKSSTRATVQVIQSQK